MPSAECPVPNAQCRMPLSDRSAARPGHRSISDEPDRPSAPATLPQSHGEFFSFFDRLARGRRIGTGKGVAKPLLPVLEGKDGAMVRRYLSHNDYDVVLNPPNERNMSMLTL